MDKQNLKLVTKLRHELHQHPEPSNYETWTKQRLIDFLKEHTQLEIVDEGKWFYAVYHAGEDKDNIAFRADFDAIRMDEFIDIPHSSKNKGVAHKCGHDGHVSTLSALALEIDQQGAEKNVYFLYQHAEETGDGAAECVKFIDECEITEIFAYHNTSGAPQNSILVIDGTSNYASKGMIIEMIGTPCHASQPENGKNPSYAIAKVINGLSELIDKEKFRGEVLCTVIQVNIGERAFGISAHKGELLLTFRAEFEEEMDELQSNIEALSRRFAAEDDLELQISYQDEFPVTSNHKESSDKVRQVCKNNGFELIELERGSRGSEDFGHFLKATKGAIFYVGNGMEYPAVHTKEYDFNDKIIETVVELFKGLIEH